MNLLSCLSFNTLDVVHSLALLRFSSDIHLSRRCIGVDLPKCVPKVDRIANCKSQVDYKVISKDLHICRELPVPIWPIGSAVKPENRKSSINWLD